MKSSYAVRATALFIAGALALAGCSSDEPTSPSATDTANPTVTSESPTPQVTEPEGDDVSAALDEYVALEMEQQQAVMDAYPGVYSSYEATADYPNTIVYTYTYAEALDPAAAQSALNDVADLLDSTCQNVVFPTMERLGVTPTQGARFVYLNPDGSEVWSHDVSSEDA